MVIKELVIHRELGRKQEGFSAMGARHLVLAGGELFSHEIGMRGCSGWLIARTQ
jgi:hypothetical protein